MQPGIFTLCLQLVRRVIRFIPTITDWFSHVENGLATQILALLFCVYILPKIIDFIFMVVGWALKIMKKFE